MKPTKTQPSMINITDISAAGFDYESRNILLNATISARALDELEASQQEKDEAGLWYKNLLKNTLKYEKEQKNRILNLQKMVGKKDNPQAEEILREFFIGNREGGAILITWAKLNALDGVEILYEKEISRKNKSDPAYQKSIKNLKKLRESLRTATTLYKSMRKFYETPAGKAIPQFLSVKNQNDFLLYLKMQIAQLDFALKQKLPGRPRIDKFYELVIEVVKLYERVTGKKFTILRHKESSGSKKGEYLPITEGHQFVCEALELVYYQYQSNPTEIALNKYSDKNIYNACENAQRVIKHNPDKI